MSILTSRVMMTPVLLLALVGGNPVAATPSVMDATAIQPVGFSIQLDFGHGKNSHYYKHQQKRRYNRYGHGHYQHYPYYYDRYKRHYDHGWSKRGYKRKHRGKNHQKHRWYSY